MKLKYIIHNTNKQTGGSFNKSCLEDYYIFKINDIKILFNQKIVSLLNHGKIDLKMYHTI